MTRDSFISTSLNASANLTAPHFFAISFGSYIFFNRNVESEKNQEKIATVEETKK